jgi:hypothetical protein
MSMRAASGYNSRQGGAHVKTGTHAEADFIYSSCGHDHYHDD